MDPAITDTTEAITTDITDITGITGIIITKVGCKMGPWMYEKVRPACHRQTRGKKEEKEEDGEDDGEENEKMVK